MAIFYCEDCLATIERMKGGEEKVDIILTSPPYNYGRKCKSKTETAMRNMDDRYDVYIDDMSNNEYVEWICSIFNSINGILTENGVILWNMSYSAENPSCLWELLWKLHTDTPFMIADCIVWKKKSALPNNVSPNKLTRLTEFVFVICRKEEFLTFNCNKQVKSVSNRGQRYYENIFNFIQSPNNDGMCNLNKATFSSDLVLQLLTIYAQPNSIIYDPFMGTGTTALGVEMYGNGCKCIGSEISQAQVDYSEERLDIYKKKQIELE